MALPNCLTIAGVDPSGGAGVLADVKTFSALGAYACAVIAALTAQNTQTVVAVQTITPSFVAQQINTLFADVQIDAVKIGMLGEASVVTMVADRLAAFKPKHIVLDPVMIAKSGDSLIDKKALGSLSECLIPLATVLTPNLPEAAVLLNQSSAETLKAMYRVAEQLHRLMNHRAECWVYLKGGHLPGDDVSDLIFNGDRMLVLPGQRIVSKHTHGTGCTLSAALAALIVQTTSFAKAAEHAKHYVMKAIENADQLQVGKGYGPLHHLYTLHT